MLWLIAILAGVVAAFAVVRVRRGLAAYELESDLYVHDSIIDTTKSTGRRSR